MCTFVAFFRGINVGGNNILPMRELAGILENKGLEDVKTYIQSGNAVFYTHQENTAQLAAEIGVVIQKQKGFTPQILILSNAEFQAAVDSNPFNYDEGKLVHFFFLAETPMEPDLQGLEAVKLDGEDYQLINKVFYLHAPAGIGRSKLAARVEKAMNVAVTARNLNTIRKVQSMLEMM